MKSENYKDLPYSKHSVLKDIIAIPLSAPLVYVLYQTIMADVPPLTLAMYAVLSLVFAFPFSIINELRSTLHYQYSTFSSAVLLFCAALELVAIYSMLLLLIRWFFLFDLSVDNAMLWTLMTTSFIMYARVDKYIAAGASKMHDSVTEINEEIKKVVAATGTCKVPLVEYYRGWIFPVKMVFDDKRKQYMIKT